MQTKCNGGCPWKFVKNVSEKYGVQKVAEPTSLNKFREKVEYISPSINIPSVKKQGLISNKNKPIVKDKPNKNVLYLQFRLSFI